MSNKKNLTVMILALVMMITLFVPVHLVHASHVIMNGENDAVSYTIETEVSENKKKVDMILSIESKENVIIQSILLPDGTDQSYAKQIKYSTGKNEKLIFVVKYKENENSEIKNTVIDVEVTGIEEAKAISHQNEKSKNAISVKDIKANVQDLDLANGKIHITGTGYKQWIVGSAEPAHETPFTGAYHITGSYSHIGNSIIEVIDGTEENPISMTLDNVIIDNYDTSNMFSEGSAMKIGNFNYGVDRDEHRPGHVELNLVGNNVLKGSRLNSGIELIGQQNNNNELSTVVIQGDGTLTAQGGEQSAAIGSSTQAIRNPYYKVIINSGTIIATGGRLGAGIGGGKNNTGGEIIINGGHITAQGGEQGAGIGGGFQQMYKVYYALLSPMKIQINGGKVNAISGRLGAGIGTGYSQVQASDYAVDQVNMSIEINEGAEVSASATEFGSGIGQGYISYYNFPDGSTLPTSPWVIDKIHMNGGTIKASAGSNSAGIGSSRNSIVKDIDIKGGDVNSLGGLNGAGIGSGYSGYVGTIRITGGKTNTSTLIDIENDSGYAAGIGGGAYGQVNSIVIGGTADVTATAGLWSAGIGRGFYNVQNPTDIFPIEIKDSANVIAYAVGSPEVNLTFVQAIDYECLTTSSQPIFMGHFKDALDENSDKDFKVKSNNGNNTYDLMMPMLYQSFAVTSKEAGKHSVYIDDQLYAGSIEKNEDSLIAKLPLDNQKLNAYWYLQPAKVYTVDFHSSGGTKVNSYHEVLSGETIKAPSKPTKEGYEFVGWYKDSEGTQRWDFAKDVVIGNITLYAKWNINTYMIEYEFVSDKNPNGITVPPMVTVDYKSLINEPKFAIPDKWTFDGWYTDKECTNKFHFDTPITFDMTLYGKWNDNEDLVIEPIKPNDNSNINHKPNNSGDSVQTGDTTQISLYFTGMSVSVLLLLAFMIRKRRKTERK